MSIQQHPNAMPEDELPAKVGVEEEQPSKDVEALEVPPPAPLYARVGYREIFKEFVLLGWTGFGGPASHIGLFQTRLVERLKWMSPQVFAELFALGSTLPGPTSTQVSFAVGAIKKGVPGGLLSGILFQYPGAFMMAGLGAGAANVLRDPAPPLRAAVAGLSAVAVALVAVAAKGLCTKVCPDRATSLFCVLAAIFGYYYPTPWMFPVVIAVGGLAMLVWKRNEVIKVEDDKDDNSIEHKGISMWTGAVLLFIWAVLLILVITLVEHLPGQQGNTPLHWFSVFYRIGSYIYGGGQVVLPLLQNELVFYDCSIGTKCRELPHSWVTTEQFFAGLGIAQGMPGPLFNFSAYLGSIIADRAGYAWPAGAIICWLGLFGPGILLIFGVMPFWQRFRRFALYKKALPGFNSAAVGLVVATVFQMLFSVWGISPFPKVSICLAIIAFGAVDQWKLFEPGVVIAGAILGICAWAAGMS